MPRFKNGPAADTVSAVDVHAIFSEHRRSRVIRVVYPDSDAGIQAAREAIRFMKRDDAISDRLHWYVPVKTDKPLPATVPDAGAVEHAASGMASAGMGADEISDAMEVVCDCAALAAGCTAKPLMDSVEQALDALG